MGCERARGRKWVASERTKMGCEWEDENGSRDGGIDGIIISSFFTASYFDIP